MNAAQIDANYPKLANYFHFIVMHDVNTIEINLTSNRKKLTFKQ